MNSEPKFNTGDLVDYYLDDKLVAGKVRSFTRRAGAGAGYVYRLDLINHDSMERDHVSEMRLLPHRIDDHIERMVLI